MKCPNCGRHMSAWSLGPPDHAPAWKCPDCEVVIADEDWPDESGDEQCKSESMLDWTERTRLVKPTGKCVTLVNGDGVHWNV